MTHPLIARAYATVLQQLTIAVFAQAAQQASSPTVMMAMLVPLIHAMA
jgi:hypothetical protein